MAAACVAPETTVPAAVGGGLDPRCVVTPLNANAIEATLRRLKIYEEWAEVVEQLRSGFDTGVNTRVDRTLVFANHSSTNLNPSFIDEYIQSEQGAGRYSRAFDVEELESIIGHFRTSPLGLVPKPHSSKFRLIQDFSFPRNDVCIRFFVSLLGFLYLT